MTDELRAPKSTVNKKFLLNTIVNVDSHNAHNIRERERAKQAARASDLVINHKASQQIRKDDEKEREMWLRRKQANMTDGQSKQRKRKRVHSADTDGFVDLSSYADDPLPSSTVGIKRKAEGSASEDKDEDDDDDDDKEDEEEVRLARAFEKKFQGEISSCEEERGSDEEESGHHKVRRFSEDDDEEATATTFSSASTTPYSQSITLKDTIGRTPHHAIVTAKKGKGKKNKGKIKNDGPPYDTANSLHKGALDPSFVAISF
jgi:hypothetical protein